MTDKPVPQSIMTNVISSLVASGIVAMVAYFGISSSVSSAVDTRLSTIEAEVIRLRDTIEAVNAKRVSDLEAQVIVLKAQLQDLRERDRQR